MNEPVATNQRLLRTALIGNAGFSILTATVITLWKNNLLRWLGFPKDFGILFLGMGLLAYAVWLLINAARTILSLRDAYLAAAMDLLWVAASVPVVVLIRLSPQGAWTISVIAVLVLCFAISQWIGIRRIRAHSKEPISEVRRV